MGTLLLPLHSCLIMSLTLLLLAVVAPALVLARSPNIVNGFDANPGEFPWQASFQTSWGFHFCGASIVSERWLVTAAHCVEGKSAGSVKVVLGLHDQGQTVGNPAEYDIAQILAHPAYDRSTISNDITLIQTTSPIQFNSRVQTIDLPSQDQVFSGQACQISGWGELGWNQGSPDILQKLDVEVKSVEWCQRNAWVYTDDKVCIMPASGRASSACRGDSGGPLACGGTLVGAASYVFGECSTRNANVYANVAHFRGWIRDNSGL